LIIAHQQQRPGGSVGQVDDVNRECPAAIPDTSISGRRVARELIRWVQPKLIAEIRFAVWSESGRVRHPVYLGLRDDKEPRDVVRPVADPAAKRQEVRRRP
jgi:ATP-dependent DNA ligase